MFAIVYVDDICFIAGTDTYMMYPFATTYPTQSSVPSSSSTAVLRVTVTSPSTDTSTVSSAPGRPQRGSVGVTVPPPMER